MDNNIIFYAFRYCLNNPFIKEEWKDIENFEDYVVSNHGYIKSKDRWVKNKTIKGGGYNLEGKELILRMNKKDGYYSVFLSKMGKVYTLYVHRLVATAFIDNPENKPQVNHLNGDKGFNCVMNLEWATPSENMLHAIKNGLWSADDKKIPIIQKSLNGIFLAKWDSARTVEKKLGFNRTTIQDCARKKTKKSHGYIWEYGKKEINKKEKIIYLAFSYCLGRKTYVVSDMVEYLLIKWDDLPTTMKEKIKKEISSAIENNQAGMKQDIEEWKKLLKP